MEARGAEGMGPTACPSQDRRPSPQGHSGGQLRSHIGLPGVGLYITRNVVAASRGRMPEIFQKVFDSHGTSSLDMLVDEERRHSWRLCLLGRATRTEEALARAEADLRRSSRRRQGHRWLSRGAPQSPVTKEKARRGIGADPPEATPIFLKSSSSPR